MNATIRIEREARQLFRLCFVGGSLDENRVRQVVRRIIETKHRHYLTLLSAFQRLLRLDREKHAAEIESAVQLPDDFRSAIQAHLEALYGLGLNVQFTTNPDLIGGMRIQVGSDVYDASVQSRLAALEKSLSEPNVCQAP
jgi:F-type H+-transporting ATPase subunit delta